MVILKVSNVYDKKGVMDFNVFITAIVTNGIGIVCAAAMIWLSYYRETVTIPKMLTQFSMIQDKALETMLTLTREERISCQKWHDENRDCHQQTNNRLGTLSGEIRENRHDIRNLANALHLRQAIEEAKRKRDQDNKENGEEG
jgi:hypothetical protein